VRIDDENVIRSEPQTVIENSLGDSPDNSSGNYDVTSDGQRLLMMASAGVAPTIVVVENWFEELKDRVPIQ
jgi:hypothetical protein